MVFIFNKSILVGFSKPVNDSVSINSLGAKYTIQKVNLFTLVSTCTIS